MAGVTGRLPGIWARDTTGRRAKARMRAEGRIRVSMGEFPPELSVARVELGGVEWSLVVTGGIGTSCLWGVRAQRQKRREILRPVNRPPFATLRASWMTSKATAMAEATAHRRIPACATQSALQVCVRLENDGCVNFCEARKDLGKHFRDGVGRGGDCGQVGGLADCELVGIVQCDADGVGAFFHFEGGAYGEHVALIGD